MGLYKQSTSRFWWTKISSGGKIIRRSTKTADKEKGLQFQRELRMIMNGAPVSEVGECYAYIIGVRGSKHPVKLGVSKHPKARLAALQVSHYEKLVLNSVVKLPDMEAALLVERAAHIAFKETRIRGEWFDIDVETAEEEIQALALEYN